MRWIPVLLLLLAACAPPAGGPDGGPDAGPRADGGFDAGVSYDPLSIDVVVRENQVVVHPREEERFCQCARGDFPPEGFCAPESDARRCACAPEDQTVEVDGPARCLASLELVSGGEVVGSTGWNPSTGRVGVSDSDGTLIEDLTEPTLRLVGCGGVAEVPLPASAPPAPTFVEQTSTDGNARLHWAGDGDGDTTFLCSGNGLTGRCCRQAYESEGSAPLPDNGESALWAMFSQLRGGAVTTTSIGDVRVWHAGDLNVLPAFGPEPLGDGRFRLGTSFDAFLFVTSAGAVVLSDAQLVVEEITADLTATDPADTLVVRARGISGVTEIVVEYALTPDDLSITLAQQGESWTGTFPFNDPTGELVLGDAEARTVALDSGLVELVNTGDADDVLMLTATSQLGFPPIARPLD